MPNVASITYVAKTILLAPDNTALALWRSLDDAHSPGRVDLPGGGVEVDEDFAATAAREITEEAGIALGADSLTLMYTSTTQKSGNDGGSIVLRFLFLGKVSEKTVQLSHEHDRYAWLSVEDFIAEFTETTWADGVRIILEPFLRVA